MAHVTDQNGNHHHAAGAPASAGGKFAAKVSPAQPTDLDPISAVDERSDRLTRAADLMDEVRRLESERGLKDGAHIADLRAEAAALRARPTRKNPPLPRIAMSPTNRSAQQFLRYPGRTDDYDLNPPYQRGSVWSTDQRRALFESLLRGIPIGSVTVNDRMTGAARAGRPALHAADAAYAVVDGKQRIEAMRSFHEGELSLPADWFEDECVLEETADGEVYWDGLTLRGQRLVQQLPIPVIEATVATIEEEARIFGLINSAGTAQEEWDLQKARDVADGSE